MNSIETKASHKEIIEFIPYKTLAMDLESILANLTGMYVNRNDADMVELITLCQAELFPIGSLDAKAERYEYVLKLAVPVKFHNHLRDNIGKIQPQLRADIATVTAPYIHEFISEVFIVIKIEQDPGWRDAALEWVAGSTGDDTKKEFDIFICHAPQDESEIVNEMKTVLARKNIRVTTKVLSSAKGKDIHRALTEFEKTSRFGVFVVSQSVTKQQFQQEALDRLTKYILNPGKKFCQIWDKISRTDVANFSPALARSLAFSTERMTVEEICGLLLKVSNIG
jgi:hypothetical protein